MSSSETFGKASWSTVAQAGLALVWAGLVLGLSFIETPLKFNAPGITQVLGVGIGRLVFTMLNHAELLLCVLLLAVLFAGRRDTLRCWLSAVVLAIVLIQTFWLLPVLDRRAALFIAGNPLPGSFHHVLFIVAESVKLVALLSFGVIVARRGA